MAARPLTRMRTYVRCRSTATPSPNTSPPDRGCSSARCGEHSVELDEGEEFAAWAAQAWPRPRYQVDLLPELGPWQGAG